MCFVAGSFDGAMVFDPWDSDRQLACVSACFLTGARDQKVLIYPDSTPIHLLPQAAACRKVVKREKPAF